MKEVLHCHRGESDVLDHLEDPVQLHCAEQQVVGLSTGERADRTHGLVRALAVGRAKVRVRCGVRTQAVLSPARPGQGAAEASGLIYGLFNRVTAEGLTTTGPMGCSWPSLLAARPSCTLCSPHTHPSKALCSCDGVLWSFKGKKRKLPLRLRGFGDESIYSC